MKVYIITKDGIPEPTVYTALRTACEDAGVSYTSAVKGKFVWLKGETLVRITEAAVIKNTNRGSNPVKR